MTRERWIGWWWRLVLVAWIAALGMVAGTARAAGSDSKPLTFLGFEQRSGANVPFDFRSDFYYRVVASRLVAGGFQHASVQSDDSNRVRVAFVLTGHVKEFQCLRSGSGANCRAGITWSLFDSATHRLVYKTITRAVLYEVERAEFDSAGRRLIEAMVDSLTARPGFKRRLARDEQAAAAFTPASFQRCAASSLKLPRQAEEATRATVIVRHRYGIGSGFFLNREGLVLTAAHVIRYPDLSVTLRDGRTFPAGAVRVNAEADVALLRIEVNDAPRCAEFATSRPLLGADTYVIGSPAGAQQAFSMSRGIVSGLREFDGVTVLQTDASVSPGNSGGPLLDADGKVLGIVSRKLVHAAVEGISYAVTMDAALSALGLHPGAQSDAELSRQLPPVVEEPMLWETDDALPNLLTPLQTSPARPASNGTSPEPLVDHETPEVPPKPQEPPPAYVHVLRWGGLAVGIVGMTIVAKSVFDNDPESTTRREFKSLQVLNGAGWVVTGIGAATFATSYVLEPSASGPRVSSRPRPRFSGAAVGFLLQGRY